MLYQMYDFYLYFYVTMSVATGVCTEQMLIIIVTCSVAVIVIIIIVIAVIIIVRRCTRYVNICSAHVDT